MPKILCLFYPLTFQNRITKLTRLPDRIIRGSEPLQVSFLNILFKYVFQRSQAVIKFTRLKTKNERHY